ncbi:MAG: DUF1828 domain-containing protein [Chloroflexota bacterium]|nr:DUF1828 domain-containing protein [Chloroflexota bacterium]
MSALELVGKSVGDFLRQEVVTESLGPHDGRVSCLTPLDYPDGDGVVVWVIPQNGEFEATDYGEGYVALTEQPAQDRRALLDRAATICADLAVSFVEGRVVTKADAASLGDATWRVASASARIAQLIAFYQPRRRRRTRDFADTLLSEVRTRAEVRRDEQLIGQSGHRHRASLFVPSTETILEPVSGQGNWSQVAAIYTKFGDLEHANGYKRLAVVDDRDETLPDDFKNMLVQVGAVVDWTLRERWLPRLIGRGPVVDQ